MTTQQTAKVEQVLTYFNTLKSLSSEELEKEYTRLDKNEDLLARLRRALLLSLPEGELQDSEQALMLLNGYLAQVPMDDSTHALALLLTEFLAEREDYERELRASQHKIETLQQQLEELKSIENSINRRGQQEEAKKP